MSIIYRQRRCSVTERLSQSTLLVMLRDNGQPEFEFLAELPLDAWEIVSFDSRTAMACYRIIETDILMSVNLVVPFPS